MTIWETITSKWSQFYAICISWYSKIRNFAVYFYGRVNDLYYYWNSRIKPTIIDRFSNVLKLVKDWWSRVWAFFTYWYEKVKAYLGDFFDKVKTIVLDWWRPIWATIGSNIDLFKLFISDWKTKIVNFFTKDLPEWVDTLRHFKERVIDLVKDTFPKLFVDATTGSSRNKFEIFDWFDKIKTICVDWYDKLHKVFVTYWDEFIKFLKNPFEYLRNIVFPLLGEMISALANGLVEYIKDKWGDEE